MPHPQATAALAGMVVGATLAAATVGEVLRHNAEASIGRSQRQLSVAWAATLSMEAERDRARQDLSDAKNRAAALADLLEMAERDAARWRSDAIANDSRRSLAEAELADLREQLRLLR